MDSYEARAYAEAGEQVHGEPFTRPLAVEQRSRNEIEEPVLKRAASVFFADMVASSTSSAHEHLNYINHDEKSPFLKPWLNNPLNVDLLPDLNIPLLPPDEPGLTEFLLQEYICENTHPMSQYHPATSEDGRAWRNWAGLNVNGTHASAAAACNEALKLQEMENSLVKDEVLEQLYRRIPTHDDDQEEEEVVQQDLEEQDLEFGNFWNGADGDILDSVHAGGCGDGCHALVTSISNLSQVLLAHYGSSSGSSSAKSITGLQSAILNLSKCLVHAHQRIDLGEQVAEVEEQKDCEEHACCDGDEKTEQPEQQTSDEDIEEQQLMARFKILLGLSAKKPCEPPPEQSCTEDNIKPGPEAEQAAASSYLNPDQVEQRLAVLKTRPNWNDDDGAATIKDETIHVEDDYMAKRVEKACAETETIVYGVDKPPSDSEESGWEHI